MPTYPSSKDYDPSSRGCVDILASIFLQYMAFRIYTSMIMVVFAIDILSFLSANITLIRASFLVRRDSGILPLTSQAPHCLRPSSTGQAGTDVSLAGRTALSPSRAPPTPSRRMRSSCKRLPPLRTHPGGYDALHITHFR